MLLLSVIPVLAVVAQAIQIPDSSVTVNVKAFNTIDPTKPVSAPSSTLYFPVLPGRSNIPLNNFVFLIEHPSGQRFMFDLGTRTDTSTLAPLWAQAYASGVFNYTTIPIVPQLQQGNVSLESINGVIWSHSHPDHIGDTSLWPNTTAIIIGEDTDTRTYPSYQDASFTESDFAGKNVTKLPFKQSTLRIGGFTANDLFKDGSFYVLNTPGHCPGHISALARVTPTTFILMAGDSFHHVAQIRPGAHLHKTFPVPKDILATSKKSISREYFWAPDDSTDLSTRTTPFFRVASGSDSFYSDPATATVSQFTLEVFDKSPNVFVVSAHDSSLDGIFELFPQSLNDWKAKGIKEKAVWAFADPRGRGYALSSNGSSPLRSLSMNIKHLVEAHGH